MGRASSLRRVCGQPSANVPASPARPKNRFTGVCGDFSPQTETILGLANPHRCDVRHVHFCIKIAYSLRLMVSEHKVFGAEISKMLTSDHALFWGAIEPMKMTHQGSIRWRISLLESSICMEKADLRRIGSDGSELAYFFSLQ
jgi:hypothetical protein